MLSGYNYGLDLSRNYIESNGGVASAPKRWELFEYLLGNPVFPSLEKSFNKMK
jgi:hypothetical protein